MRRSFVILLALLTLSAALPASAATVRDLRDTLLHPAHLRVHRPRRLYALGRAHARDRFFQMDVLRHTFSGTLAEMVGTAGLASDVQLRTLGLRRAAEASLPAISRETRVWLDAYARGVNSYILDPGNPLPLEYAAPRADPRQHPPLDRPRQPDHRQGARLRPLVRPRRHRSHHRPDRLPDRGHAGSFDGGLLFSEDVYRLRAVRSHPLAPRQRPPAGIRRSGGGGQAAGSRPRRSPPRTAGLAARYRAKAAQVPLLRDALERRQSGRGSNWWVAERQGHRLRPADPRQRPPSLARQPRHLLRGATADHRRRPAGDERLRHHLSRRARPSSSAATPGSAGAPPPTRWTSPTSTRSGWCSIRHGLPTATIFEGKPEPLVVIPQTYLVNQVGNGTARRPRERPGSAPSTAASPSWCPGATAARSWRSTSPIRRIRSA